MLTLTSVVFLLLGWLVGVAINHAANVLPAKETFFQAPFYRQSHMLKPPQAWSAIIAYLTQTHRDSTTQQSMGLRPLVVELAVPLLFLFLVRRYDPSAYRWFVLVYTMILVLLTVTDLEHRLIQNIIILPAILIAVGGSFFSPYFNWRQAILGGAIGFVVFYLFALLSRGGLGSGDVTLATFLGLITGFPNVIPALLYGVLFGGVVSVLLLLMRRVTMKTFIPYGPFLIISGWSVLIWGGDFIARLW